MEMGQAAVQAMNALTRAMEDATSEYVKAAEGMSERYSNTMRGRMNQRGIQGQETLKAQKQINDEYDKLYTNLRKIQAQQEKGIEIDEFAKKRIKQAAERLSTQLGTVGVQARTMIDSMEAGNEIRAEEFDAIAQGVAARAEIEAQESAREARRVESQDQLKKSLFRLKDAAAQAADTFFTFKVAGGLAVTGFMRSIDELEFAMKHQSDMYAMISGNMDTWAGQLGLAPLEMQKMVAEYRPLINSAQLASGSITTLNDSVANTITSMKQQYDGQRSLIDQAYRLTGNYNDAANLVAQSMNSLQRLGTAFNMDELSSQTSGLIKQMAGFAKVTGESTEQQMKMIQQHLNSSEVQTELLKLSKQRRMGRIQEIMESVRYQAATRGSVEAALEAEKALSKLGGMSTKDRFKEAAKLQAVAGGMGVQMDPRMMEIIRKPEEMRTNEERKLLSEQMNMVSQALTSAQAAGGGRAMAAETMFGQLSGDMQSLVMSQNTQMTEGLALDQKTFDEIAAQTGHMSKTVEGMADLKQTFDSTIGALWKDPTAQIIAGGIAGIGASAKVIQNLLLAQTGAGIVGNVARGGRAAGGALASAGRLAGGGLRGAGAMAGVAGTAAGGVALAGALGYAAGTVIDKGLQHWAPDFRDKMSNFIGESADSLRGMFDSGFAEEKSKKEARYKSEEEWEKKRNEQQQKTNELKDELDKQQIELAKAMVAAQTTGNEEAVKQQETTIKATEAQIAASHKQTVEIARAAVRAARG